jgi:hypothetical protein
MVMRHQTDTGDILLDVFESRAIVGGNRGVRELAVQGELTQPAVGMAYSSRAYKSSGVV